MEWLNDPVMRKMDSDQFNAIKSVAVCCSCFKPMTTSKKLNFVFLGLQATWKTPTIFGSVGRKPFIGAIAILCDNCIAEADNNFDGTRISVEITHAIEFRDGECFYHHVDELQSINVK